MLRRLTQFYKIMTGLTPEYLRDPIPELRNRPGERVTNVLNTVPYRTGRYRNSFYPDSVLMWNEIGPGLRGAVSLPVFKRNLLNLYRPAKKASTMSTIQHVLNGFSNLE